jgi:hypothetical protein
VAQFPTNVHLDLLAHGLIADPFMGTNENDVQWVGETGWVYRVRFATPKGTGKGGGKAVLVFEGLDTFATVALNGKVVIETENMFVPERIDVTDVLRGEGEGENELVVEFDSAYLRGWKLVEKHPKHTWGVWNGDNSRLAVRKAQYHWVSQLVMRQTCRCPADWRIGLGLGTGAAHVRTVETGISRGLRVEDQRHALRHGRSRVARKRQGDGKRSHGGSRVYGEGAGFARWK